MAEEIVNLAKVPNTGLIVQLMLSQGRNKIERALGAKRAVYANGAGVVNRVAQVEAGTPFTVAEKVTALVLAVSGDPVSVSLMKEVSVVGGGTTVEVTTLTVTKLLLLDDTFSKGFAVATSGSAQLDITYQN